MRAPDLPRSPVFPIPRTRSGSSRWLWSAGMICRPSGSFLLLPGKWSEDLKRPLLAAGDTQSRERTRTEVWAAAFLGMVLRQAREGLLLAESRIFRPFRSLRWEMNIGFPSGDVGQETVLRRRFRRLGRAAWVLSLEENVTLERAQTALCEAQDGPDHLEECPVEAFPEIVAGAQAYARGTSRRNGLHILLDIGATGIPGVAHGGRQQVVPLPEGTPWRLGSVARTIVPCWAASPGRDSPAVESVRSSPAKGAPAGRRLRAQLSCSQPGEDPVAARDSRSAG